MLNKSVARRYAEAFFSIAKENGKIEEFQQELETIVKIIDEVPNLKEYYNHLLIPAKQKKEATNKIFSGQISQVTLNFLLMVIDKKRETYISVIVEEYKAMADEYKNITKAELIAAHEIPESQVQSLADKLSTSTGRTVQFNIMVDPTLLGGLKIRIGDQIIDGTVAKKLEMLRGRLKQAKIS